LRHKTRKSSTLNEPSMAKMAMNALRSIVVVPPFTAGRGKIKLCEMQKMVILIVYRIGSLVE